MVMLKKNPPLSLQNQTLSNVPFTSTPNFLNFCSIPTESMLTRIPRPKIYTKYPPCLTPQTPETPDEVSLKFYNLKINYLLFLLTNFIFFFKEAEAADQLTPLRSELCSISSWNNLSNWYRNDSLDQPNLQYKYYKIFL